MKFEDAIARIQSFVGSRYDSGVVSAFVAACEEGQIRPGSVKLKSRATPALKTASAALESAHDREAIPVS
jgi:hypothetical protein